MEQQPLQLLEQPILCSISSLVYGTVDGLLLETDLLLLLSSVAVVAVAVVAVVVAVMLVVVCPK